jgi:8-oxo-dGTP pyrophosphatase MutT (NUDIX family)
MPRVKPDFHGSMRPFHPGEVDATFVPEVDHNTMLQGTGFWCRRGAGCLFVALDTGRILFSHRSRSVEEPGTYGTWGGAMDSEETPGEAALREALEEGAEGGVEAVIPVSVFDKPGVFAYYNFLVLVPHEFEPYLTGETQGFRWVEFGDWPEPLHPGVANLLRDPASLEIIRRYAVPAAHAAHTARLRSSSRPAPRTNPSRRRAEAAVDAIYARLSRLALRAPPRRPRSGPPARKPRPLRPRRRSPGRGRR